MPFRIWITVLAASLAMAQEPEILPEPVPPEPVKIKRFEGGRAGLTGRETRISAAKDLSREAALSVPTPFVPMAPCRLMDTRDAGKTGAFGPPALLGSSTRTVPVPASGCGIPAGAIAYSLNITVVPSQVLGFLTVYPSGQARPLTSTLNSFDGAIVANAALVPAGVNGGIDIFVTDRTDVVVDINGYFALTGQAVQFYTVTPCRVMDTRAGGGMTGAFGPPVMTANSSRDIPLPASGCGVPATARAYLLNITVVPRQVLGFLQAWPAGQLRPVTSTLNSFQGRVLANMALLQAGANGAISIFVTDQTDVIVDINGYLAP